MSERRWEGVSYLDAIRPEPGWRTEHAVLASYSADLIAFVAALLSLAGLDDDRGSGSKVDFAGAIDHLTNRVRLVVQAGRLTAPTNSPKVLGILDRFIAEVRFDERHTSWHPKTALVKHIAEEDSNSQWRLWIGSRNLTRDLSWDTGLALVGRSGVAGSEIDGVSQLGRTLSQRAGLPAMSPAKVEAELADVRWELPPGCTVNSIHLAVGQEKRQLPLQPVGVNRLAVVSPFLDSGLLKELAQWGSEKTHRTLLSTLPELTRLASEPTTPLARFSELLYLDAPPADDGMPEDEVDRTEVNTEDEEPEPRGLHAKIIFAQSPTQRRLWMGSANATTRGWFGANAEVTAELDLSPQLVQGFTAFIGLARAVQLEELAKRTVEDDPVERRLEDARKQILACWSVTQHATAEGTLLRSTHDPNPDDAEIAFSIGYLAAEPKVWPRGLCELNLGPINRGEESELVRCIVTLGNANCMWIERAPMNPPPGDERDHQAISNYLGPRVFLAWIRSMLTDASPGDGGGSWDEIERPKQMVANVSPTWWAPTLEEMLRAWARDPDSLQVIDEKLSPYLNLLKHREQDEGDAEVIDEFRRTWDLIRCQLIASRA